MGRCFRRLAFDTAWKAIFVAGLMGRHAALIVEDDGGGVDYDTLVHAAVMAGHSREDAEDAIDSLRDIEGSIIEPRFSFFRLTPE